MEAITASQMTVERLGMLLTGCPEPSTNILLSGSGRSGTTWLMNILASVPGTQPIFEPLHPRMREVRSLTGWDRDGVSRVRLKYLRLEEPYPAWEEFLDRLLSGKYRAAWTDYDRRNSYLPKRFLIKEIRANMMLGYIYENFAPRIVYIIRHPCAVIQSRLRNNWHAEVAGLLSQEELVEDYLRPWLAAIEREKDLLGAHAVWWAVENAVALEQLAIRPHYFIAYEDLVLDPQPQIQRLLEWLGLADAAISNVVIDQTVSPGPSPVSYESKLDRLERWRTQLSGADQRRILDWAHRFGIEMYDDGILPRTAQ